MDKHLNSYSSMADHMENQSATNELNSMSSSNNLMLDKDYIYRNNHQTETSTMSLKLNKN